MLGLDKWKGQKQSRDEKTQEHYRTTNMTPSFVDSNAMHLLPYSSLAQKKVNYKLCKCILVEAREEVAMIPG